MSFSHTVTIRDNKAAKQKAEMVNERRRQARNWLRRNSKKKNKPIVTSGVKDK